MTVPSLLLPRERRFESKKVKRVFCLSVPWAYLLVCVCVYVYMKKEERVI